MHYIVCKKQLIFCKIQTIPVKYQNSLPVLCGYEIARRQFRYHSIVDRPTFGFQFDKADSGSRFDHFTGNTQLFTGTTGADRPSDPASLFRASKHSYHRHLPLLLQACCTQLPRQRTAPLTQTIYSGVPGPVAYN